MSGAGWSDYQSEVGQLSTTVQGTHGQHLCGGRSFERPVEPLKSKREYSEKNAISAIFVFWAFSFKLGLIFVPKCPTINLKRNM